MTPVQGPIDNFGELPPVVDEDALLADLAFVVRTCGTDRFFASPILTPTKECFPDPWAPNHGGVQILAQRLMLYAGLAGISAEVELYTDPEALLMRRSQHGGLHQGAAAYFAGIAEGKAVFACESANIGRPESLVGTMGHEVAHAFRAFHGVTVSDRRHEEELTDITSVYLGFGIFACNASRTYERSGTVQGAVAVTRESTQRLGYLPPRALAFLLACQMVARGYASRDVRRFRAFLKSDHKEYFKESVRDLRQARLALLEELKVSEADADRMTASAATVPSAAPIVVEGISKCPTFATAPEGPTCPQCGQSIDYEVKDCPHCRAPLSNGCSWYVALMAATVFLAAVWRYGVFILLAEAAVYLWTRWPWRKSRRRPNV